MQSLSHNEIQLVLPTGWQDGSHLIAQGPPQTDFRTSVVLVSEALEAGQRLEDVAAKHLSNLQEFPLFKLKRNEAHQMGPYHGILREYSFTYEGQALTQMQFSTAHGSRVFTLTYSDTEARFEQSRAVGLSIFQSLQFRSNSGDAFAGTKKLMELAPQAEPAVKVEPGEGKPSMELPRGPVRG